MEIFEGKKIKVGKNLTEAVRHGIPPSIMCHKLDIKPEYKLVKQKLRHQGKERIEAAKEEFDKLLKASIIQECQYSEWLSNVVLVKKPNGKWRMCVDFTDLNKACPKDDYPLPKINQLVDFPAGHALLSFMEDQPHTAFITSVGVYCHLG